MAKLYNLLPAIVRARDLLAAEASGNEPVLENLLAAVEGFSDEVTEEIEGLPDLITNFDAESAMYLALMLGSLVDTSQTDAQRERFVKGLVAAYKIKGTKLSWNREWLLSEETPPTVVELFKSEIYETGDYAGQQDGSHLLAAARVQFYGPCESGCETGSEISLTRAEQERLFNIIDPARPVHVLLPSQVTEGVIEDPFAEIGDTLGCFSSCETGEETWTGSVVQGTFEDAFVLAEDSLEITLSCTTTCEGSCTSCCETGCQQSRCQLICVTGCETSCTISCEDTCMACCEQECMQSCRVHCQDSCEGGFCEFSCENSCQAHECEAGSCQSNCTSVARMLGTGPCQSQSCELVACTQGACMLLACTITSCTMTAEAEDDPPYCLLNSCQGVCEFACIFGCTGESCEASSCEAGVAQGLTYTTTGEFCNRCPPTQEAEPNVEVTCELECTNAFEIHKTEFPGYGCTTAGCQGGAGQVETTPTDSACVYFCQTLAQTPL